MVNARVLRNKILWEVNKEFDKCEFIDFILNYSKLLIVFNIDSEILANLTNLTLQIYKIK